MFIGFPGEVLALVKDTNTHSFSAVFIVKIPKTVEHRRHNPL